MDNYEARRNLEEFRKLGYMEPYRGGQRERTGLELEYRDAGTAMSDWDDIDRHWKSILLGRQVKGLAQEEEASDDTKQYDQYDEKATGSRVGTRLHPYLTTDIGGGEEMSEEEVSDISPLSLSGRY